MGAVGGPGRIITLTTDFGLEDNYVGIMKGIISRINPDVRTIDITHDLPPHNIAAALYQIETSYRSFPTGTIHLAAVDPGVGTDREAILIETDQYLFVGPDNGIFGFLKTGQIRKIIRLNSRRYFSVDISDTFHGRDLFAPAAGYLSLGIEPDQLGKKLKKITRFREFRSRKTATGLRGKVIYIDHFGNLATSLRAEDIPSAQKTEIVIAGENIGGLKKTFGSVKPEEPLAYINSFGYLEIAVNLDSAAEYFGCTYGDRVEILFAS